MKPCIIVHGGAGDAPRDDVNGIEATAGCRLAADAGFALLASGASSLDAVTEAVRLLEDNPRFNAGTGASLTRDGTVELDASVMTGAALAAGAVANVTRFRNPVLLARAVMEHTPHVLLVGAGADAFGRERGLPEVDNASLITARMRQLWAEHDAKPPHGTVGAVAIDANGRIAAATSTGGTEHKRAGRVGDSPLIGCGTYADDEAGGCSATGLGEAIIRVTLARHAVDLMRAGQSAPAAAQRAVETLRRGRGTGGVIVIDHWGQWGFAWTTRTMSHAWRGADTHGEGFKTD